MNKINNFKSAKGSLDVTLYANTNGKEGFYARVSRRTVTLENLIADIAHSNSGVSQLMVQHIASLLQDEIVRLLGLGFSVNLLELGTLYLAAEGSINGTSLSDIPPLTVHFTPSDLIKQKAAAMKVEHVLLGNGNPRIVRVEDTFNKNSETAVNTISVNRVARIVGARLKMARAEEGDGTFAPGNGVYIVPVLADGSADKDESNWQEVSVIAKNKPSTIEFYVPESLASPECYVAVKTTLMGPHIRKTPAVAISPKVTVAA